MKTYTELMTFHTYEERLLYLQTNSLVGEDTFGFNRYLNQSLYTSKKWRSFRNKVILRDNGCDLACEEIPIFGKIIIHHINPITQEDILNRSSNIFDMNNVICVSHSTHNAIHYRNDIPQTKFTERSNNDTSPWRIK